MRVPAERSRTQSERFSGLALPPDLTARLVSLVEAVRQRRREQGLPALPGAEIVRQLLDNLLRAAEEEVAARPAGSSSA